MIRLLLLSMFLADFALSQSCITGYTAYNNRCIKVNFNPLNRYDASGSCAYESSRLVKIDNAFTNTQMQQSAGSAGSVWLGLKCASSDLASCGWDDGTFLGSGLYGNFAPGHPNAYIGTCVYLYVQTGFWHSVNCTKSSMPSICEYEATMRGSASCMGVSPYQDSEKQQILKIHNDLRSKIALGTFVAKTDKKPPATNMEMMSWSCELENSAQAFADHCTFSKAGVPPGPIPNAGQNIYGAFALDEGLGTYKGSGIAAAKQWESVLQKKGWPSNQMTTDLLNSGIASGTQMAWWKSNQIGCGVAECPTAQPGFESERIVVCQYLAQGNLLNQMIYSEGPACSACASGFVCDKPTGLCKQQ